jgi:hypothetical protein
MIRVLMLLMKAVGFRLCFNCLRNEDAARRPQNGAHANRDQQNREQEGARRVHHLGSALASCRGSATSISTNVNRFSLSYSHIDLLVPNHAHSASPAVAKIGS